LIEQTCRKHQCIHLYWGSSKKVVESILLKIQCEGGAYSNFVKWISPNWNLLQKSIITNGDEK
jgi:hypothetical protein